MARGVERNQTQLADVQCIAIPQSVMLHGVVVRLLLVRTKEDSTLRQVYSLLLLSSIPLFRPVVLRQLLAKGEETCAGASHSPAAFRKERS